MASASQWNSEKRLCFKLFLLSLDVKLFLRGDSSPWSWVDKIKDMRNRALEFGNTLRTFASK